MGTAHGMQSTGQLALATDLSLGFHGFSMAPAPLLQLPERVCGKQVVVLGKESDTQRTETGLRGKKGSAPTGS